MSSAVFGKNFIDDVLSAGLGALPICWGSDGTMSGRERLTAEQIAALDAVIAAHVPAVEDSDERKAAKAELAQLDLSIPRSVEDLLDAGVIQEAHLSGHNLARLRRKREVRSLLHA